MTPVPCIRRTERYACTGAGTGSRTHLNPGGNCEEAFRYYETHLGGRIATIMRVRDLPPGIPGPPGSQDAVIHAVMDVAGIELIGNDVPPEIFQPIRSSYLYLKVDSPEAAERIYAALADGGEIGMPIQETFFATRFAQLRDRFGTLWTILHQRPG
jgi:PhnB protein